HEVQHDQVRRLVRDAAEGLEAVVDALDVVPVADQVAPDDVGEGGIVVHDDDAAGTVGAGHDGTPRRRKRLGGLAWIRSLCAEFLVTMSTVEPDRGERRIPGAMRHPSVRLSRGHAPPPAARLVACPDCGFARQGGGLVLGELYEDALAGLAQPEIEHADGRRTPLKADEWMRVLP